MRLLPFLLALLFASSIFAADPQVCLTPTNELTPSQQQSISICTPDSSSELAQRLGWKPSPVTSDNLCGGYYFEPATITAHPNPLPLTEMQMDITSTGPAVYSLESESVLQGDVTLTQPGREIRADKATLIPNKATGKIEEIDLEGNVRFQEAGRLIVGQSSQIDMANNSLVVNQGAYHMVRPTRQGHLDAWGTAEKAHRMSPILSTFKDATYTTCQPTDPSWYLASSDIKLNKETGRGQARNVVMYARNVPFFYTPYLSFPIDKRRYSGFLYPSFGYDNESGAMIGIPYYFNLAPNYDDTLTVSPMTKRGVMLSNLFRYLTPTSSGALDMSVLPDDRAFRTFKRDTAEQYPPSFYNNPFLNTLNHASNNRGSLSFHDETIFNPQWSGTLDANYVTDDYYFQNFGTSLSSISTDQLLNQAAITYTGEHWQFGARAQAWQTLHPINQNFVLDQYQRLPELSLSSYWPNAVHGLDFAFNSEWVYFNHVRDFFTNLPYPTGSRLHINPQVSLPLRNSSAFFIPALGLDMTSYSVSNNGVLNTNVAPATIIPDSNPNLNKTRALPVFNIDSGLYFDREFQFGQHGYNQTLEPRAFYLFVPEQNQNNIPVFDTTLPPFTIDELYRTNRFVGYDRLGDANQMALGLTTRVLDGYTGDQKLSASVGAIYYFQKHSVCLYPDCRDDPTIDDHISPIAAQLTYSITPAMSLAGNAAWDPNNDQLNNSGVSFRYSPSPRRIVNVGYNYIQNGDVLNPAIDTSRNNLHRIDLSVSWPLSTHWNLVGNWNYNISHTHPQTYFYGAEYETCCWAVRVVSSRILQTEDVAGNTSFRSAYYVQFLLNGLGSAGDSGGSALLLSSIPGYVDKFTQ